jgi:membrane protease YdiL (CAAX protease family)
LLKQNLEEVPWTTRETFNGTFFTLIPWLAFSVVLSLLNTSAPAAHKPLSFQSDLVNAIISLIFAVVVECAFLIAPYYYARHYANSSQGEERSIWKLLGFRGFNVGRALPWMILLSLSFLLANMLYLHLISTFHLNVQTNDQRLLQEGRIAPLTTYATLFAAVVAAPFCEEVFFRSFVFMGLRNDMPLWLAIVLSALIFGVAHGDPGSFPVLFCIGLALAFLRWYTRSIWPGFILHTMNNGLGTILLILALHGINI